MAHLLRRDVEALVKEQHVILEWLQDQLKAVDELELEQRSAETFDGIAEELEAKMTIFRDNHARVFEFLDTKSEYITKKVYNLAVSISDEINVKCIYGAFHPNKEYLTLESMKKVLVDLKKKKVQAAEGQNEEATNNLSATPDGRDKDPPEDTAAASITDIPEDEDEVLSANASFLERLKLYNEKPPTEYKPPPKRPSGRNRSGDRNVGFQGLQRDLEEEIPTFPNYSEFFKALKDLTQEKSKSIQLPKVRLMTFDGNLDHWQRFFDVLRMVRADKSINPVQKLWLLKGAVKGEPLDIIQNVFSGEAGEGFEIAYQRLVKRFNNTQRNLYFEIEKLFSATKDRERLQNIKTLLDLLNNVYSNLQTICSNDTQGASAQNIKERLFECLIIHSIQRNFDNLTSLEYAEMLEEEQVGSVSIERFTRFLEKTLIKLEAAKRRNLETNYNAGHQNKAQYYGNAPHYNSPNKNFKNSGGFNNQNQFRVNSLNQNTKYSGQNNQNKGSGYNCDFCHGGPHRLEKCQKFLALSVSDRWQRIKSPINKKKYCPNCLLVHQPNPSAPCKLLSQCREPNCSRWHHTVLHFPNKDKKVNVIQIGKMQDASKEMILPTLLVKIQVNDERPTRQLCVLDTGSNAPIVSEHLARKMSMKLVDCDPDFEISAITDLAIPNLGKKALFKLYVDSDRSVEIEAYVVSSIMNIPVLPAINGKFQREDIHLLLGIQQIYYLTYDYRRCLRNDLPFIRTNVGIAYYGVVDPTNENPQILSVLEEKALSSEEPRVNSENSLSVDQTPLVGYEFEGPFENFKDEPEFQHDEDDPSMIKDDLLDLPSESESNPLSFEADFVEKNFRQNTVKLPNGQYQIRLPFKPGQKEKLGENRLIAFRRLVSLEKMLAKDPEKAEMYHKGFSDLISSGRLERVPMETFKDSYHLCHHPVYRYKEDENGICTKVLRIVFNGSVETRNYVNGEIVRGPSLNETLFVGNNQINELTQVLLNFQRYAYGVSSDITAMYLSIAIHPDDRNFLQVLYRSDPSEPVSLYRFTALPFGISNSSHAAIRVLRDILEKTEETKDLFSQYYVDDHNASFPTKEEAVRVMTTAKKVLAESHYFLHKFKSNDLDILKQIVDDPLYVPKHTTSPTLGIHWNTEDDTLSFKFNHGTDLKPTKRSISSDICSYYDPLGKLLPVMVKAKYLFQETHLDKLSWDDQVSPDLHARYLEFKKEMDLLNNLKLKRWLGSVSPNDIQLIGFCDGSQIAAAGVVYSRIKKADGSYLVSHLMSRQKLCPAGKLISIPRMELAGASLLAAMIAKIASTLKVPLDPQHCILLSDSQCTLAWIRRKERLYQRQVYIFNRVSQILKLVPSNLWYFCPGELNVADLPTRLETSAEDLLDPQFRWWTGGAAAQMEKFDDPSFDTDLETKSKYLLPPPSDPIESIKIMFTIEERISEKIYDFTKRFKSYPKLLNATAYLLRFKHKASGPLTREELDRAELRLLLLIQKIHFGDEIARLKNNVSVSKHLLQWNLFLDELGLIRLAGRLDHADDALIPLTQKRPILLPPLFVKTADKKSCKVDFIYMLIKHVHETNLHCPIQLCDALLRQKFFILNAMTSVKHVLGNCLKCYRVFRAKPLQQLMGSLPAHQVSRPISPMHHCQIDYYGPINLRCLHRNPKPQKAWICSFTCVSTKYVLFELVLSYSSPAFLRAVDNVLSRGFAVSVIHSDRGSNLLGAQRLFKRDFHDFLLYCEDELLRGFSMRRITWQPSTARTAHTQGLAERMNKNLQRHLDSLQSQPFTIDEMQDALLKISYVQNSRPLYHLSSDQSLEIISPFSLVHGRQPTMFNEKQEVDMNPINRLQSMRKMIDTYWEGFFKLVVNEFQRRTKWQKVNRDLKPGELVLVYAANTPKMFYPMAIVESVSRGADNHVRFAKVRYPSGFIEKCNINNLCYLPTEVQPSADAGSSTDQSSSLRSVDEPGISNPKDVVEPSDPKNVYSDLDPSSTTDSVQVSFPAQSCNDAQVFSPEDGPSFPIDAPPSYDQSQREAKRRKKPSVVKTALRRSARLAMKMIHIVMILLLFPSPVFMQDVSSAVSSAMEKGLLTPNRSLADSFLFGEIGLMLEQSDEVLSYSGNSFETLFIHFPSEITFPEVKSNCSDRWSHTKSTLQKEYNATLTRLRDVFPEFSYHSSSSSSARQKRDILRGMLSFAGLAGLAGSAWNAYDIRHLEHSIAIINKNIEVLHLNSEIQKFNSAKIAMVVNNITATVFPTLERELANLAFSLSCVEASANTYTKFSTLYLSELPSKIHRVFSASYINRLTPDVIALHELKELIKSRDDLKNSLYHEDPNLAYVLGRFHLIRASHGPGISLGGIISLPKISKQFNARLFLVSRVNHLKNGVQLLLDAPSELIYAKGKFWIPEQCSKSGHLLLCSSSALMQSPFQCMNEIFAEKNFNSCTFIEYTEPEPIAIQNNNGLFIGYGSDCLVHIHGEKLTNKPRPVKKYEMAVFFSNKMFSRVICGERSYSLESTNRQVFYQPFLNMTFDFYHNRTYVKLSNYSKIELLDNMTTFAMNQQRITLLEFMVYAVLFVFAILIFILFRSIKSVRSRIRRDRSEFVQLIIHNKR